MVAARRDPRPPVRLVVLDIGGTLIEERGDVPQALGEALTHHGVNSTPEEIGARRGASKREIIRYFVDAQNLPSRVDRDKLTAEIHDEFTANLISIYQSVPPIAGAEQAIKELRQSGYLVATTTGFDRAITKSIFSRLGWERYFAATICSTMSRKGAVSVYALSRDGIGLVSNVSEVVRSVILLDLQAGTNAGLRGSWASYRSLHRRAAPPRTPYSYPVECEDLPALLTSKVGRRFQKLTRSRNSIRRDPGSAEPAKSL